MTTSVASLFPTPVMRIERLLDDDLITQLMNEIVASNTIANAKSDALSHTEIMSPRTRKSFVRAGKLIQRGDQALKHRGSGSNRRSGAKKTLFQPGTYRFQLRGEFVDLEHAHCLSQTFEQ